MQLTFPLRKYFEAQGRLSGGDPGVPVEWYTDSEQEYHLLHRGVGIRDCSHYALLDARGTDVLDFLHRISTNQLRDMKQRETRYTVFTNDKGRILDRVQVINNGDNKILIGHPGKSEMLAHWIRRYVIMDDVQVQSLNGEYALLELHGAQAAAYMILLFDRAAEELVQGVSSELRLDGFSYLVFLRESGASRNAYRILCTVPAAEHLLSLALDDKNSFTVGMVGETAYRAYRIEQGVHDTPELNDRFNPLEAILGDDISFTKGCYIGQEVIARLDTYAKVQRKLVGFMLGENHHTAPVQLVDSEGNDAGEVTDTVFSPKFGKGIGIGYVRNAFVPETETDRPELYVKGNGKSAVTVTLLPMK